MHPALWALIGMAVGALIGYVIAAARAGAARAAAHELRTQVATAREDFETLRKQLDAAATARVKAETELSETRKNMEEQKRLLDDARAKLADTFKALSAEALKSSNEQFLQLAKKTLEATLSDTKGELGKHKEALGAMLKPLGEALGKYEKQVQAIESSRQKAYGSLEEQLKALTSTHRQLQKETGELVNALRRPQVRGRWGELTLKRVAELAGMSQHCDFTEQVSVDTEEGRQRPDMIVHMPAGRDIVVDAKVPLNAYLEALEADSDEKRERCIARHARQMRERVGELSRKQYWKQFGRTPEFVVLFVPAGVVGWLRNRFPILRRVLQ